MDEVDVWTVESCSVDCGIMQLCAHIILQIIGIFHIIRQIVHNLEIPHDSSLSKNFAIHG